MLLSQEHAGHLYYMVFPIDSQLRPLKKQMCVHFEIGSTTSSQGLQKDSSMQARMASSSPTQIPSAGVDIAAEDQSLPAVDSLKWL
ncbi:hypothetical protein P8452_51541 [Trifolium repens]|nr:hypothetical protein P8452_51541 [Trifolium repens]